MQNSSFFLLPESNSFCSDILVQSATSYFFFAKFSSIPDTHIAESFTIYSPTPIVSSLAPNFGPIATPLASIAALFILTQTALSNIEDHDGEYKYTSDVELSTISPESFVITYSKTFIKTEDLAYISKIKKHSKVWDHDTQLLEVQSKKKY